MVLSIMETSLLLETWIPSVLGLHPGAETNSR
jgi:hypothetical protein